MSTSPVRALHVTPVSDDPRAAQAAESVARRAESSLGRALAELREHGWTEQHTITLAAHLNPATGSTEAAVDGICLWLTHAATGALGTFDPAAVINWAIAVTHRSVGDAVDVEHRWTGLLGPELAPLAWATGITLNEALALRASGELTRDGLLALAALQGLQFT